MFCGQETQSWNSEEYNDPYKASVDSVMRRYNVFVNNDGYNSPYWNFQRRIKNRTKKRRFYKKQYSEDWKIRRTRM